MLSEAKQWAEEFEGHFDRSMVKQLNEIIPGTPLIIPYNSGDTLLNCVIQSCQLLSKVSPELHISFL